MALSEHLIRTLPRDEAAGWWAATDTGPAQSPLYKHTDQLSEVECRLCLKAWEKGDPPIWARRSQTVLGNLWPELVDHLAHVHGVRTEPYECP